MADSKDDPKPRPAARPAVPPFRGPSGTPHSPLRPVTPPDRAARPPLMPPPMAGKRPATPAAGRPAAPPAVPSAAPRPAVVAAARGPVVPPTMTPPPMAAVSTPPAPAAAPPVAPPPAPPELVVPQSVPADVGPLPSISEFVAAEPMDPHELPEPTWDDADHVFSERVATDAESEDPAQMSSMEEPPRSDSPSGDEGIETYDDALGFGDSAYDVSLPAEAALQDTSTYPTAGLDLSAFAAEPEDQASELLASAGSSGVASDALTEWEPRSSGGYPTGEAEIYAPEPPAAWESSAHMSSAAPSPGGGTADALEAIAGRIRRGELILGESDSDADETAALAAVLLALIRQRR